MLNNCVSLSNLSGILPNMNWGLWFYAVLILLGFGGTALADHTSVAEYEPEIKSVSIISQPLSISLGDNTYGRGEVIKIRVTFYWPVKVTGTPYVRIKFQTGGGSEQNSHASFDNTRYDSSNGSDKLEFHYKVVNGDRDDDGFQVFSPIQLEGGTIKDADSQLSIPSDNLSFERVVGGPDHRVNGNGYNDNLEPTIASDGILITSTPLVGTTYGEGEVIKIKVLFLRPVKAQVTSLESSSRPKVQLQFINPGDDQTSYARYASGSGSKGLEFHYTVESDKTGEDGFMIKRLLLNSKNLTDTTTAVSISDGIDFPDVYGGTDHKVDGTKNNRVPLLSSDGISIISAPYYGDTYREGGVIRIQAEFLRPVRVIGTPYVRLKFCNGPCGEDNFTNGQATYASGSGTKKLEFHYTVEDDNIDTHDGFEVRSPIQRNEGTIIDTFTWEVAPSNISFDHVHAGSDHNVNGNNDISSFLPKVRSVDIISTPGLSTNYGDDTAYDDDTAVATTYGITYGLGDIIKVGVQLFRPVTVDVGGGTPDVRLKFCVGSCGQDGNDKSVFATYASGSGSGELEFHYTIADRDTADSIELRTPINLRGGTIKDKDTDSYASDDLVFSNIRIDQHVDYSQNNRPKMPKVIGAYIISTPQVGTTYGRDEVIKVQINFIEPVVVDMTKGTPYVRLGFQNTGNSLYRTRYARYASGSGSDALEFHYTVKQIDDDANGIVVRSPVRLNGGTIQNQSGGDSAGSNLVFSEIPASTNHKVDGSQDNLGPGVRPVGESQSGDGGRGRAGGDGEGDAGKYDDRGRDRDAESVGYGN